MISCTEFIFAYSSLFKFLEKKEGKQGVIKYWEHISDTYVADRLGQCVKEAGLKGCWDYWTRSLAEEASDCRVTLDEENGVFTIEMFDCPSKRRLLDNPQVDPYPHYCEHCDLLYRRVLEPFGFTYDFDMSNVNNAACRITVSKK